MNGGPDLVKTHVCLLGCTECGLFFRKHPTDMQTFITASECQYEDLLWQKYDLQRSICLDSDTQKYQIVSPRRYQKYNYVNNSWMKQRDFRTQFLRSFHSWTIEERLDIECSVAEGSIKQCSNTCTSYCQKYSNPNSGNVFVYDWDRKISLTWDHHSLKNHLKYIY